MRSPFTILFLFPKFVLNASNGPGPLLGHEQFFGCLQLLDTAPRLPLCQQGHPSQLFHGQSFPF